MNRTSRASWGFLTGLAAAGVSVLISLAATPLILRWLGEERFGAFRAASDWTGHLTIFELGLAGALTPLLAQAVGRGRQAVRAVLRVGMRVYLGVALLMLAGGAGLALFIPKLVPVSSFAAHDLRGGCWAALLTSLVVPLSPFRALAEADQRSYLINGLLILQTVVVTGTGLVLAWAGCGITGQFLATSLGAVLFLLLLARDGQRRYQLMSAERDSQSLSNLKDIRRKVFSLNRPSLIQNVCGRIGLYTDNLLIAFFWSPVLVVPFFLTQRMTSLAQTQLQGIGNSSWAGLVELAGKGAMEVFHRRLIELSSFVVILGVAVMVPLAAFNRAFISIWVGPETYGGDLLTLLAGTNGIFLALFSLWGLILSGAGHVGRVVPGVVAATAVNITASIMATITLGLPGPVLGTLLASTSVYSWFFPWLLHRHFQVPIRKLIAGMAAPVVVGIPYAFLIAWWARAHPPHSWIWLGLDIVSSTLIYLLLAWVAIFGSAERTEWIRRIKLLLRPVARSIAPARLNPW
jgi:O-antigen/teichoic acid export membrane protein